MLRRPAEEAGPEPSAVEAPEDGATLEWLAEAYVDGHPVDWAGLYRHQAARRTSLPTYPFSDARYWVELFRLPELTPLGTFGETPLRKPYGIG